MYIPKRPTPTTYALAGGFCTIGIIAITARILHSYTDFALREPFDSLTFIVAAIYALGGAAMGSWLGVQNLRRENAALRTRIAELIAERQTFDALLEAIQKCDAQGEVNTVLSRKILKAMDEKRGLEDTQPIARLHSINGGSRA